MKLVYTSARGNELALTQNSLFNLIGIDGQTSATASLSSQIIGTVDGDTVTNEQVQPRSLSLELKIANGVNVEEAKRAILDVVKIKQKGVIVWTQNDRTVRIEGIVESVDMPRWENGVTMQITLHCEQPFWEDIDFVVQEISEAINMHYFTDDFNDMLYFPDDGIALGEYDFSRTREFNNEGDVSVGIDIEIVAADTVTNPIIYDTDGNFFGVGYGTGNKQVVLQAGDVVRITTQKGNKTVKKNGTVSLFDKIKPGSTWLQLGAGKNTFSVNSDDLNIENMTFSIIYKRRYV